MRNIKPLIQFCKILAGRNQSEMKLHFLSLRWRLCQAKYTGLREDEDGLSSYQSHAQCCKCVVQMREFLKPRWINSEELFTAESPSVPSLQPTVLHSKHTGWWGTCDLSAALINLFYLNPVGLNSAWCNPALEHDLNEVSFRSITAQI